MKIKEILPFLYEKNGPSESAMKMTEASLFNLLVYTHNPTKIDYFRELVDTIISKFPCKVIFILGNTEAKEDDFKVEQNVKISGTVVCEHIEIKAGGKHLSQVPSYILPHLAPDLPIYLIWGQDPTEENEVLPKLIQYAERLIFDSETAHDLPTFANHFINMRDLFPCELLDMSWARSAGWRDAIASAIDSEEKLEILKNAKTIKISYNNRKSSSISHPAAQAEFFQAWLASRLDWKLKSKGKEHANYGGVQIEIFPEESKVNTPGSILSFFLEGPDGEEFKLNRVTGNLNQVTVAYSTKEECHLPYTVPFQTHSKGLSFVREILFVAPSRHYFDTLKLIADEGKR